MTIKEVSEKYAISEDTLRYYERIGVIRPVTRKNGIRNYGDQEIANIEFVLCMRAAGLSVKVLKQYLDLYDKGESTKNERLVLLTEEKAKIEKKIDELNRAVDKLNYKIGLLK